MAGHLHRALTRPADKRPALLVELPAWRSATSSSRPETTWTGSRISFPTADREPVEGGVGPRGLGGMTGQGRLVAVAVVEPFRQLPVLVGDDLGLLVERHEDRDLGAQHLGLEGLAR